MFEVTPKQHGDMAIIEIYTDASLILHEIYFTVLFDVMKKAGKAPDSLVESHAHDTIELFWGFKHDLDNGTLDHFKKIDFQVGLDDGTIQQSVLNQRKDRCN